MLKLSIIFNSTIEPDHTCPCLHQVCAALVGLLVAADRQPEAPADGAAEDQLVGDGGAQQTQQEQGE